MRLIPFLAAAGLAGPSLGFAPPSLPLCPAVVGAHGPGGPSSTTRLRASDDPAPLATEGDWSAYLDAETTGYVYYFNAVSGESTWEKPTATFPDVDASSAAAGGGEEDRSDRREARREERRRKREEERREKEEERRRKREQEGGGGGGFFGTLFGGGKPKEAAAETPQKTKKEQLTELSTIANNDDFLSELDSVIAEAEEAIAIADRVEEAPPQNKGGFFSNFGFVSGKEAIEEAETLVEGVEERTSNAFSRFGSGARAAPKAAEKEPESAAEPEENPWVEGLMGLFQKSFEAFIPPQTKQTEEKKVVAVDSAPKEKKAEVSGSDFLDVVWGAETSARPTLNIAEMMKAFQVQSKDADEASSASTIEDEEEGFRTVELDVALSVKAHPEKASWGGEDAGFVVGRTFGVFDGVSGATKVRGKKLYSRSLADSMKRTSGRGGMSVQEITDRMTEAKELADDEATGASTAVVASIGEDNVLRALNLGDSVCLVLRDGAVAARTREIIHYFDCPYQLGDDSPDRPRDGTSLQTEVFRGDVVVAGSDGVFDNLSDADVCGIVESFGPRSRSSAIAQRIVDRSRSVSLDPDAVTPYSTVARGKRGYERYRSGRGGKVDDISCVVVKAS